MPMPLLLAGSPSSLASSSVRTVSRTVRVDELQPHEHVEHSIEPASATMWSLRRTNVHRGLPRPTLLESCSVRTCHQTYSTRRTQREPEHGVLRGHEPLDESASHRSQRGEWSLRPSTLCQQTRRSSGV